MRFQQAIVKPNRAYQWRDGQAVLAYMAGNISKRYRDGHPSEY